MEIEFKATTIVLKKELTEYDDLAIAFTKVLDECKVSHVYVSGYVAIMFGRSRVSEDIDVLVDHMSAGEFASLWDRMKSEFHCHNSEAAKTAYNDYLEDNIAVRFSRHGTVIPNVEFKWAHTAQHKRALAERMTVDLDGNMLPVSRIEEQIAHKLFLGSDKDFEDARYLHDLFKERLDKKIMEKTIAELKVRPNTARKVLGWGK